MKINSRITKYLYKKGIISRKGVEDLKITIADPKIIKEPVSIISELVTEVKFKLTKNGLELIAMDPASVALVIFKILSSSFIEYEIDKDEELSINLNYLKQVLKRAKTTDTITMETVEGFLNITLKGRSTRRFSLPLIELEEENQRVPELKDFKATIELESSTLNDAIGDVDIIGESVAFIAQPEKLIISSSGDLGKASIEINADEFTKIEVEGTQKAKYSIEYLKKMIKASKLVDVMKIKFATEYPLQLEYKQKDAFELVFILAPRMDND